VKFKHLLMGVAAAIAIPASTALATMSLQIVDRVTSGPTNEVTVNKGATFQVRLNLVSVNSANPTSEQTTGLDYYLQALGTGNGFFSIDDRDISTSPYSDMLNDDTVVEKNGTMSVLNPRNAWDLGGNVANPNAPVNGNVTTLVAFYQILVKATTPNGQYVIETISDPGTGWVGGPSDTPQAFGEHEFNFPGSYTVNVIPEPAMAGVLGLGMLAGAVRRRR